MKPPLFLLLFLIANPAAAQSTDTLKYSIPKSWKRMELAPRIAFGTQKAFYLEAGAVLQRYIYDARHGFVANAIYAAAEWIPAKGTEKTIIGAKLGAETVYNGSTGGIDIKYLTDGHENDVMITPKFGFGVGVATLFYGYNFSTSKYPFERIRKHQFSLAINTNLLFYAKKYERGANSKK